MPPICLNRRFNQHQLRFELIVSCLFSQGQKFNQDQKSKYSRSKISGVSYFCCHLIAHMIPALLRLVHCYWIAAVNLLLVNLVGAVLHVVGAVGIIMQSANHRSLDYTAIFDGCQVIIRQTALTKPLTINFVIQRKDVPQQSTNDSQEHRA